MEKANVTNKKLMYDRFYHSFIIHSIAYRVKVLKVREVNLWCECRDKVKKRQGNLIVLAFVFRFFISWHYVAIKDLTIVLTYLYN